MLKIVDGAMMATNLSSRTLSPSQMYERGRLGSGLAPLRISALIPLHSASCLKQLAGSVSAVIILGASGR